MFEVMGKQFKFKMGIKPKAGVNTTIIRRVDLEKRVGFPVDWPNLAFVDADSNLPFFPIGGGNPTARQDAYMVKGVADWFIYFNARKK